MNDELEKHLEEINPSYRLRRQRQRAPLRKIVGEVFVPIGDDGEFEYSIRHELLECGHHQRARQDCYGPTNAARRRCIACLTDPPDQR